MGFYWFLPSPYPPIIVDMVGIWTWTVVLKVTKDIYHSIPSNPHTDSRHMHSWFPIITLSRTSTYTQLPRLAHIPIWWVEHITRGRSAYICEVTDMWAHKPQHHCSNINNGVLIQTLCNAFCNIDAFEEPSPMSVRISISNVIAANVSIVTASEINLVSVALMPSGLHSHCNLLLRGDAEFLFLLFLAPGGCELLLCSDSVDGVVIHEFPFLLFLPFGFRERVAFAATADERCSTWRNTFIIVAWWLVAWLVSSSSSAAIRIIRFRGDWRMRTRSTVAVIVVG